MTVGWAKNRARSLLSLVTAPSQKGLFSLELSCWSSLCVSLWTYCRYLALLTLPYGQSDRLDNAFTLGLCSCYLRRYSDHAGAGAVFLVPTLWSADSEPCCLLWLCPLHRGSKQWSTLLYIYAITLWLYTPWCKLLTWEKSCPFDSFLLRLAWWIVYKRIESENLTQKFTG